MTKKSRKRAAKYSELSRAKQKKRKQLATIAPEQKVSIAKETQEAAATKETVSAKASTTSTAKAASLKAAKAQPERKITMPSYQYVRDDLKRIGILAGAIVVILIILAFVLS
jgi:predicted flap endonuclease-1-like 5' DNA nuclease